MLHFPGSCFNIPYSPIIKLGHGKPSLGSCQVQSFLSLLDNFILNQESLNKTGVQLCSCYCSSFKGVISPCVNEGTSCVWVAVEIVELCVVVLWMFGFIWTPWEMNLSVWRPGWCLVPFCEGFCMFVFVSTAQFQASWYLSVVVLPNLLISQKPRSDVYWWPLVHWILFNTNVIVCLLLSYQHMSILSRHFCL